MALKVIGAGLGRTGTASLKLALEQLGFGACYHMGEILGNQSFVPLWQAAGEGSPDWETIFAGYQSAVDYPACTYWRELMAFYPEAKVLLSVRDANSWFDSLYETIMSPATVEWIYSGPMAPFFRSSVYRDFGDRIHDREFMVCYFNNRIEEIKAAVPAEKLLVYNVKEGWEPLCRFLQVQVPHTDFPRVNSRDETSAMLHAMIAGAGEESSEEIMRAEKDRLFVDKKPV